MSSVDARRRMATAAPVPVLTEELLRRKAEHVDGVLADMEEVALHQLELESVGDTLNRCCNRLKILYLQNNIISEMRGFERLRDLRYLNLALNNVTRIDGLQHAEFLDKLDLTVNFVDIHAFEASIEHLAPLSHLRELHLVGNPAMDWAGARAFVAARLPQLQQLDGKDITRTERILANQCVRPRPRCPVPHAAPPALTRTLTRTRAQAAARADGGAARGGGAAAQGARAARRRRRRGRRD